MTRYELHCKRCDQILGYMTFPGSEKATEIINSTQVFGEYSEILCPTCEGKRDENIELAQLCEICIHRKVCWFKDNPDKGILTLCKHYTWREDKK